MLSAFADTLSTSGTYEGIGAIVFILVVGAIFCAIVGALLFPALFITGMARRQAEQLRNKRTGTVLAQYEPPHGLSPAEVGFLYDMRAGQAEIIATLFDLEQRGIIRIIDDRRVTIIDQQAYGGLAEYEKIAIRFAKGETGTLESQQSVQLPFSIISDTGAIRQFSIPLPPPKSLRAFSRAIQQSITAKGIPIRDFASAFTRRVLITIPLLGLLPMLLVGVSGTSNGVPYDSWSLQAFATAVSFTFLLGVFFMPAYLAAAIVLTWIWTKIAGRYWINTKQARALWPELEGYKLYLKQVDLDNIQFESTDRDRSPVTKTLPYAIVFDLETRWQERLAGRK